MVLLQGKKGSASQRSVVKCHSEAKINSKPAQHSTMIKQHKGINTWCSRKTWRHQHRGQTVRMRQHTRASRARAPTYTCNRARAPTQHVQPVRVHQHRGQPVRVHDTNTCNPCACTNIGVNPCACSNIGVNPCACTTSLPCLSLTGCGCFPFRRVGNIAQCMDTTCNNSTCGISRYEHIIT